MRAAPGMILPAALDFEAFSEIAVIAVLTVMDHPAIEIDPYLAAHVDPAAAEGKILGQIAA